MMAFDTKRGSDPVDFLGVPGHDPAHRRAVDAVIRRGDTTVIYVTHRPDEIPRAIHRVLRLRV